VLRARFWSLLWRSRSQHDLAAKSCPPHNLVIWSLILQLFHRNDHHIEMTCCKQHLGRYLEGQGHSMTLQQNRVRPITLLCEVRFYKYFTEIITILRRCVTRNDHHIRMTCLAKHFGRYLEGQGHSKTLQQTRVWSITLLFEVGLYNYLTEMNTILRWFVTTLPILWLSDYYTALY